MELLIYSIILQLYNSKTVVANIMISLKTVIKLLMSFENYLARYF